MNRVCVTGLGALTPVGLTVPDFFEGITAGRSGIDRITYFDTENSKCTLAAELHGYLPENYFDRAVFRKLDRFTQYALVASDEAVADSRIAGAVDSERFGVYFGSGVGGLETMTQEHQQLLRGGARRVSPQFIPKMIANIAAGNIAIRHGARGACICVMTACASGTSAIGEAYRAIKGGYLDACICGGSEAVINPLAVAGFSNSQALSPETDKNAASLPFDKRRSGFVMGEGAGVLILESVSHAVRRGARILAEVVGYGSTCDATHITSPDPSASQSARAIRDAAAGIRDVDARRIYVNAHGTGTAQNDPAETQAMKITFGEDAYRLHISSTKSMTGHMLGAAGGVEAIAAILAIERSIVPPTINLQVKDPDCDLDYTPGSAVRAPLDAALSTSLGFGGHNACVAFRKYGV